ncbi:MAG: DUF86 domain-containing protein [Chloroflexota bacterium]|nr:DUF86 domain-containing protein [Chloroflexota bacterium]
MSDDGDGTRSWRLYVEDMIEFGGRVLTYTNGMDQATFIAEQLAYDATLRNIELIGVAAMHVPGTVREAHPEIEWRSIVGARNRLAHAYLGIDDDVVWDIIQTDIPRMLLKLQRLLDLE